MKYARIESRLASLQKELGGQGIYPHCQEWSAILERMTDDEMRRYDSNGGIRRVDA